MIASQAIVTKRFPATSTKPGYIRARCRRGALKVSIHFGRIADLDRDEDKHSEVARMLCESFLREDSKRGPIASNPWGAPFVTGVLPNGDFCHVFTK